MMQRTPKIEQECARRCAPAFTLLEILVVIGIIAILIALLAPALSGAMTSARRFQCQMSMRSVAFDFAVFADETLHGNRGNDALLGRDLFTVETFQETQYGVDEFWRWGPGTSVTTPDDSGNDPMRCPEVSDPIVLRANSPCSSGAVTPSESISYAFNLRLHRQEVEVMPGAFGLRPINLTSRVLQRPDTPLLIDADGKEAQRLGVLALYTAPSAGSTGPLGNDSFWFPSSRHGGSVNVAFVGGQVLSTRAPDEIAGWADPADRVYP